MRKRSFRRWLGSAVLVLVPTLAVAVFGFQAFATNVSSTPDLPGGVFLTDLRESNQPSSAKPAPHKANDAPVVDLTTWQETISVSPVRR